MTLGCNNGSTHTTSNGKQGVYDSESRAAWQKPDVVINKLGDISNAVIADIGSGTGYFSFRLGLKSKKVIAIDIDPDMLELMDLFAANLPQELQNKIETRKAYANTPNLKNHEVDIIVIINTMTYINNRKAYLEGLRKTLINNGKIMILNFKQHNTCLESPDPSDRVSLITMKKELIDAGYKIIEADTISLDHQYILIASLDI